MAPESPDRQGTQATTGHDRLHDGAVQVARDACPMLACLLVPLALVLVVAYYAASSDDPVAPAASAPPQGPYAAFRFERVGVGVDLLIYDGAGYRPGD